MRRIAVLLAMFFITIPVLAQRPPARSNSGLPSPPKPDPSVQIAESVAVGVALAAPLRSDLARAMEVLDAALARSWNEPDPREYLPTVFATAVRVDPVQAMDRLRKSSVKLAELVLPPTRDEVWFGLAVSAAPHDRELRNLLLERAISEGRKSLTDPALWKPDFKKPWDYSQKSLDAMKELLGYEIRLWEAVVRQETDPAAAEAIKAKVFAETKGKWFTGSDEIGPIDAIIVPRLKLIEPPLTAWTPPPPRKEFQSPAGKAEKAAGRLNDDKEVLRILDDPKDTSWLKGPDRIRHLQIAAVTSYHLTGKLDGIRAIVAGLNDRSEGEEVLRFSVSRLADAAPPEAAIELLKEIKSTPLFIMTSCRVVSGMVKQP
jgi:hypothetical protein